MKRFLSETTVIFVWWCALAVLCTSCASIRAKRPASAQGESLWLESGWGINAPGPLLLRWRFMPGMKVLYRAEQRTFVQDEEGNTSQRHSMGLTYGVTEVSGDGTARITLTGNDLEAEGEGFDALRFLFSSSDRLGGFSITQYGEMTDISGFVDMRSIPVFPETPVDVGARWTGDALLAIAPDIPEAVIPGTCTYHVARTAEIRGNIWVWIDFEGEFELIDKEIGLKKVIGIVQGTAQETGDHEVIADRVVPGSPADEAGMLPGDAILRLGSMDVHTWLDLSLAVSLSPVDRPTLLVVERNGQKTSLAITPQATMSGIMNASGHIKGSCIFDATRGVLIAQRINPFVLTSSVSIAGYPTRIDARIESDIRIVQWHGVEPITERP
ncbi:MAG: PDZ domain-containing protein [bacterium]